MSSARASLRGSGDTLSRRLRDLRADILARGVPRWHVYASGFAPIVCTRESQIPRAFAYLRRRGASVATVVERRCLVGCSVCVNKGVDWLLLSNPVLIPSPRYERSESAERNSIREGV